MYDRRAVGYRGSSPSPRRGWPIRLGESVSEGATISSPSPWRTFNRKAWAALRHDTPLTLHEGDVEELRGLNVPLDLEEVETIYLPLTRLLNLWAQGQSRMRAAASRFLGEDGTRVPFVIGLAGSVAVGKSTFARVLRTLLARWPHHPNVALVTTDGFLFPNAELARRGLMERKGFPESYDRAGLLEFVAALKSGQERVEHPIYSHQHYDVVEGRRSAVEGADIVLVEGLNVLQSGTGTAFVSDFFDFTIYLDAALEDLRRWYVERFRKLRDTAFRQSDSYFRRYAGLSNSEIDARAFSIWTTINERNLLENIAPTRERATLILRKGADHRVIEVKLRRL